MVQVIGFSAEYVENMTPGERKLYWMYYERDEAERKKRHEQGVASPGMTIGAPIDHMSLGTPVDAIGTHTVGNK